ncbi:MAG: hypothetical protein IKE43_11870 [Coriobacteriales bacterium]|nr:hypothetical protein [Coriobacteriales bacterium]
MVFASETEKPSQTVTSLLPGMNYLSGLRLTGFSVGNGAFEAIKVQSIKKWCISCKFMSRQLNPYEQVPMMKLYPDVLQFGL